MVNRVNTLSIYVPKSKMTKRPVERLSKLSETKERSINYLVVEAILQFLDREEKKKEEKK
jgi:predicted transcriptional regulator